MKYSDLIAKWLEEMGYTHCFYVAGGNIMHLLASVSKRMKCIAVVHEVAAGIATEYFNEVADKEKAFSLVTAGPGLTNIITAMAGAYLESRELLVLGGQVKTTDLNDGTLRQRGIQEIAGTIIAKAVTRQSRLLDQPVTKAEFTDLITSGVIGRKAPIFLEIPLDVQGRIVADWISLCAEPKLRSGKEPLSAPLDIGGLVSDIRLAKRPMLMVGGGISNRVAKELESRLNECGVPITTTWNGADRIGADHLLYFGRPNTWGQRYSNILLQQADLLVALGTRLGLQQTGFNWQEFVPSGRVIQVDIDQAELNKGHPHLYKAICADANEVLKALSSADLGVHKEWVNYCREVKQLLPLVEDVNRTAPGYVSPYTFVQYLSKACANDDIIIPCSSGGAFTVMMQTFHQKTGQRVVTNKGLASMGYGLSGAIGAALCHPEKRIVLVEGDGGFAQNLQELGTVAINNLNVKIFIFDDNGYASIRMTQRNYFAGKYIGCDTSTGLGMPHWGKLFDAYAIPFLELGPSFLDREEFFGMFESKGPVGFLVKIDPEQTYFPKITSRITESGSMVSNPLHLMAPDLDTDVVRQVMRYLRDNDVASED